ncbi:MAG: hypothetical protein K9L78_04250 [Victivallales bacterium]|nr:hypothetical protein [Victivallales bacterium]
MKTCKFLKFLLTVLIACTAVLSYGGVYQNNSETTEVEMAEALEKELWQMEKKELVEIATYYLMKEKELAEITAYFLNAPSMEMQNNSFINSIPMPPSKLVWIHILAYINGKNLGTAWKNASWDMGLSPRQRRERFAETKKLSRKYYKKYKEIGGLSCCQFFELGFRTAAMESFPKPPAPPPWK